MTCLTGGSVPTLSRFPGGNDGCVAPPRDCTAPLQLLLDQNRILQVNLARSFWRGIGDIKEVLTSPGTVSSSTSNSTFYLEDQREPLEDDNFFEDMTSLYRKQTAMFQRSCQQLRDIYRLDITPPPTTNKDSPFGEVEAEDVEELYVEVLYSVIHMIGCDADRGNQWHLMEHLRKVFHMEPGRHLQLYEAASTRDNPKLKLNLCIMEARDLVAKDISGTSNPYCTFYVTSNKTQPQSTTCKQHTLDPVWNETYTLDVVLGKEEKEMLHVDVWNFDTDDKVKEKLKRINQVKDGRGLKQLIVDTVAITTDTHQSNKLIGHLDIDLADLPACGTNKWCILSKMDGKVKKNRGEVHLIQHLYTLATGHLDQHRRLLNLLVSFEVLKKDCQPYTWNDNFTKETLQILAQHAVQGLMTRVDTALARYLVYCQVHFVLPLDYRVFVPLLEKLRKPVQAGNLKEDQVNQFYQMSETLAQHCIVFIRKHRYYMGTNFSKYQVQLEAILKCLHILHSLKWRTRNDIVLQVEDALLASVREWFNFVLDRIPTEEKSDKGKMKNLTRITLLLIADLNEGMKQYQAVFRETLNIDYVELTYREYDQSLTLITKSLIDQTCDDMKPIIFTDSSLGVSTSSLKVGTALFELYLALQQFYNLGQAVIRKEDGATDDFTIFHSWFIKAVAKWLDIALYKAMVRIVKAVQLDHMVPVDHLSNHSSSAVDLRTVLHQISTFWTQLNWPDLETSFVFISRIMDDVCKAIIFYTEKMCSKVEENRKIITNSRRHLNCTVEQCLAINNIDYVIKFINPFVQELGIDSVLGRLEDQKGGLVADACRKTIRTLVKNSVENVENQILSILEEVGAKMAPTIERFLFEGDIQSLAGEDKQSLLQYLDHNLIFLKSHLVPANFERVLSVMWAVSAKSLSDIVHQSIDKKKPTQFFINLYETFKVLLNFFYGDKIPHDGSLLTTKRLLELFASDLPGLVRSYYRQRHQDQQSLHTQTPPLGSISIKLQYLGSHLRIKILNCRHLKPLSHIARSSSGDFLHQPHQHAKLNRSRLNKSSHNLSRSLDAKMSYLRDKCHTLKLSVSEARLLAHRSCNHGMANPYVTVRLVRLDDDLPVQPTTHKFRTATRTRTLFPLYDQTFDFILDQDLDPNQTYLLLTVKDQGPLGDKMFLGESVIPLTDISRCDSDCRMEDLQQIQMALTRPGASVLDILTALETRRNSLGRSGRKWLAAQRRKILM